MKLVCTLHPLKKKNLQQYINNSFTGRKNYIYFGKNVLSPARQRTWENISHFKFTITPEIPEDI